MDDLHGFSIDTSLVEQGFGDAAGPSVATGLGIGGWFHVECYDSEGKLKWVASAKNIIPNVVINDVLNVYFGAGSNTPTFYMGMVDNAGFAAFAATDTMASHTGWVENTACTQSARPTWTPGAASNQSIQNSSQVVFNMNASATIKGFFLAANNTLGGTAGNLVATAALGSVQPCNSGDTLKVTYVVNGTTS